MTSADSRGTLPCPPATLPCRQAGLTGPGSGQLASGNQAIGLAVLEARVALGTGYPGTPSTEILEHFHAVGGRAQWAPNEKVALEVGLARAAGSPNDSAGLAFGPRGV